MTRQDLHQVGRNCVSLHLENRYFSHTAHAIQVDASKVARILYPFLMAEQDHVSTGLGAEDGGGESTVGRLARGVFREIYRDAWNNPLVSSACNASSG